MAMAGGSCHNYHADDHHHGDDNRGDDDDGDRCHYGNFKSQAGMVWSGSSSVFCGATVIRFSIFCLLV